MTTRAAIEPRHIGTPGWLKRLWSLVHARVVLAALLPLATFFLQWLLWPVLRPFAWIGFAFTVAVSTWIGGAGVGVWATCVSTVLVWWAFLPPEKSFDLEQPRYYASTALFVSLGLGLSAFQGRLRRAIQQTARALEEARQAKEKLERIAEERLIFEELVNNSPNFIGIAETDGRVKYLNPAARRLVALPDDCRVEDTSIPDYVPTDMQAFATDDMARTAAEEGAWTGETTFRNWRTGERIPVAHTSFVIRNRENGRVIGLAAIVRDIRERKRRERDQQFLNEVGFTLARTLDYE